MPPEMIAGRYEVLREIGRGGMGAVWLCRDDVLGRQVAVKQLGGLPGETAPHLARSLREARASAALTHPHVVSIYDAVEDSDRVWLVMEYVPSRTLSALTSEEGPLPPRRAAFIGAQIADGLAAAHAGGTVHRDVKPSNVLVGDGDLAKIADFGIARHVDDETLTQTGMVTGTPMFFSPQLARGVTATSADDVWALGATLYTVVEGKPPWPQEANLIAMLHHIAAHPPPRPAAAGPLTDLITRMLSADPADRPDMASVAAQLHAFAGDDPDEIDHPTVAFAHGPPTVERERQPPAAPDPAPVASRLPPPMPVGAEPSYDEPENGRGRRWLPVAALVVVLVLLGIVGAVLLFSGGDDDPSASVDDSTKASVEQSTDDEKSDPADPSTSESPPETTPPTETTSESETTDEPSTDAAQFVTDYYALLPSDTKSAWDLLSDGMQAEVGSYGSYKGFWRTIDAVSVDGTSESSSGDVTVELTYSSDDGTESETRLITVEDTGEGLQIVGDQVV
jgi:serine/threonine protein kinase